MSWKVNQTVICYEPDNLWRHNISVVIGKTKMSLKGTFQCRFSQKNQPTFNVNFPKSVIVKLLTTSPKKRHWNLYTYDDRRLDDTWKTVIEHLRWHVLAVIEWGFCSSAVIIDGYKSNIYSDIYYLLVMSEGHCKI